MQYIMCASGFVDDSVRTGQIQTQA